MRNRSVLAGEVKMPASQSFLLFCGIEIVLFQQACAADPVGVRAKQECIDTNAFRKVLRFEPESGGFTAVELCNLSLIERRIS